MRWRASLGVLAAVAVVAALPAWSAKKKQGAPLQLVPDQHAEVADLFVPPAAQDCFNWSWAAGIEAMLRAQQVETLPQSYFIRKLYPGDLCVDEAVDFERLGRAVDGEYVVDAGRKVRLESRFIPGPPTIPDDLIAPLRQGRPLLMFWKARAYVLYGMTYDEYLYPNGQRMYLIRELKLVDPLDKGAGRRVSFVNGKDDPSAIEGIFEVTAEPIDARPWVR